VADEPASRFAVGSGRDPARLTISLTLVGVDMTFPHLLTGGT
jgi:hypothetical protein